MYLCALRPRGEPLGRTEVFSYIARLSRGLQDSLHTVVEGPFAAIAVQRQAGGRPWLARWRQLVGVGDVRLDNAHEIAELAGLSRRDVDGDLQLVLAAFDRVGEACIRPLLGDFAFAIWDARAQKLLAARDAFGVKPLFGTSTSELVLYSSEIGPLRTQDSFDPEFVEAYLGGRGVAADKTIWSGIGSVPPATLVRHRGTVRTTDRYWSPEEFPPAADGDEKVNCLLFRHLLERGVRTRLEDAGDVWAHLSGGLDSSAVVALAQLAPRQGGRLAGTVTIVDSLGEGDERRYSDAVAQRFGLRNEQVRDFWPWQDDGEPPPRTDQPTPMYPFYARDRRMLDIVRGEGGRVLLSGLGSDHYLHGSLDYITDLAAAGRVGLALREVTNWSVATRQSFWRIGRQYLIDPFMGGRPLAGEQALAAPWAGPVLGRRRSHGLPPRTRGGRFAGGVAEAIRALPRWMERFGGSVEMRYPFLYRPLVELSLQLPPTQRVRPFERKWILRQAMRDLLPEHVRTRTSKGGIDGRILWALQHERQRLDGLLRDPVLAQLGFIDAGRLRQAVEDARRGVPVNNVQLFSTLSLETWLAVQRGAWKSRSEGTSTAA